MIGDAIICKGIRAEIKEILFQDAYIGDDIEEDRKYIDIEFIDTQDKYRRWKSSLDGGKVDYKNKNRRLYKEESRVLEKFYEPHCGRYFVYFDEIVSEDIIKGIIHLLINGYVMSVADDGTGGKMYVIFSIEADSEGISGLYACKQRLYNLLHEAGVEYFTSISFKDYKANPKYQSAIDFVLEKACYDVNCVDGWSIAMFVNYEGQFEFVEVLNACE